MMKKILFLLTIAFISLQSATIKDIKVFERENGIDLLLLSDKIFASNPKILEVQNQKVITLKNVVLQNKWQKDFQSKFLNSLEVFSRNKELYIVPKSKSTLDIKAAKSKDGYTLRLRFTPEVSFNHIQALMNKNPQIKFSPISLPVKNFWLEEDYRYWIVLGIMAFLILLLFFIKRSLAQSSGIKNKFDLSRSLQITSTKRIDKDNKIVLLKGQNHQYILLLGNKQSLLIDKTPLNPEENKNQIIDDNFWNSLKEKQNFLNKKNAR